MFGILVQFELVCLRSQSTNTYFKMLTTYLIVN